MGSPIEQNSAVHLFHSFLPSPLQHIESATKTLNLRVYDLNQKIDYTYLCEYAMQPRLNSEPPPTLAAVASGKSKGGQEQSGGTRAADGDEQDDRFVASKTTASLSKLAPFNPSHVSAQQIALQRLCLKDGDVLFDLGCGDGRFLALAAQSCMRRMPVCVVMATANDGGFYSYINFLVLYSSCAALAIVAPATSAGG